MRKSNKELKILIVEDSPTQAEQLKYLLKTNGFSVTSSANGKEALSILLNYKPDLIISDILMPEMDGFELSKNIKADERLKDIPVILLTSLSDPTDVIRGLECGADNFITKPYNEQYLISRTNYMLLSRELRKSDMTQMGIEIYFGGQKYNITSERQQILNLLLSTYETAVQKNNELIKIRDELKTLNERLEEKVEERTASLMAEIAERKRAEEKIESLKHQNELILNSAGEGILGLNPEGNHTFVNPAAARMLGYEVEELIGRYSHSIWHHSRADGSPYPREECSIYAAYRDGAVRIKNDEVFWRKDGTSFPVRYTSTPILEDGKIIGAVASFRDITESKRAEEKIKRLSRLFSMLSEINETIIRVRERNELFQRACRIAVEKGLFRMTWIGLIDSDTQLIKPVAHWGVEEGYPDKIQTLFKEVPEALRPIAAAIREGKYTICNDLEDESCIYPCRNEAIKLGYRSMAAFPLRTGTNIIGAVNFYSGEPHFFDNEEISTLDQLAEDISFALEYIEQQEQLQKRIEELEKFYEMGIGRELRVKKLKDEIKRLKAELTKHEKVETTEQV